jgi:Tol biopolymer transport system component
MSPEQATGERVIDARTDQYSLGALAYEMLTGEPPHVGATSQAIIARLLTEAPRPIRAVRASVPVHIEAAVGRALEKLPADRWTSTREFADALSIASMTAAVTADAMRAQHAQEREVRPARSFTARMREPVAWLIALGGVAATGYFATRTPAAAARSKPLIFDIELPRGLMASAAGGAGTLALDQSGTMLAFQARDSTSAVALYLRRLDETSIVRVAGTDNAGTPTFSSDGRNLRFFLAGASDSTVTRVFTVPISGGERRLWLTAPLFGGRWAERAGAPVVIASRAGLGTAPTEGGTAALLLRPDSLYRRFAFPEMLPGGVGALVGAFVGATSLDSAYLAYVSLPDGNLQRLSIKGARPKYSPTGHLLWITAGGELWAATWSPSRPLENGTPFRVATGVAVGPGGGSPFTISDNGVLAYVEGEAQSTGTLRSVMVVSRSGVERPSIVRAAFLQHPRVSPDGKSLLVSRGTSAEASLPSPDIWWIDLARGVEQRITVDSTSIRPYWFPDNERMAYIRRYGQDSGVAYVRRVDGTGTPIRIGTRGLFVRGISVSPRGDYLAFTVGGSDASGGDDVWLVHVDSLASPRPLLNAPYAEFHPRFSPDGRWLAYVSVRDGSDEVYVRALSGGPDIKVSTGGGREPVWSRAGDELFFRESRFLVAAKLSVARGLTVISTARLFDASGYSTSAYGLYDVTPDGREFLFIRNSYAAQTQERDRIRVIVDWPLLAGTGAP